MLFRSHLDGARLFNAAVAQGVDIKALTQAADSLSFCLSKGLCAPVGSLLCGSAEFIARAHRIRKQLGGGMRQVGVLAAAGVVALESMIDRLAEDHARARRLAAVLAEIPGVILDPGSPHTNMIFFTLQEDFPLTASQLVGQMELHGVRIGFAGGRRFRLVTHYWIGDRDILVAGQAFREVLNSLPLAA